MQVLSVNPKGIAGNILRSNSVRRVLCIYGWLENGLDA